MAIRLEAAFRGDAHPWRPVLSAALAATLAAACAPHVVAPEVLELLQKRPLNPSGVYLNESLVFHFSKDLDRASVNPQSVRIAAPDGRGPKGTIQVEGDELRFVPDPVLASDLSDGGYLPDTEYTVRFLGFPNPDGLRAADGAPLARTETWVFRTVPIAAPREGPVFEDSSPEVGLPIQIASRGIRDVPPNGPITLEGGEPVDPSTFLADDFELRPVLGGRERNREAPVKGERIPLRARIAHNRDPRSGDGRTILQLWPERVLDRGRYVLAVQPDTVHLRDFGGHPVWPFSVRRLEIEVGGRETPAASNSFLVSFLDTDLRSSAEVPEVDGTAHWSSTGRVEVRFPAAAGSGVDGNLALAGDVHSRDVNAVRLDVARGQTATLAPEPGLVILRAQKRLSIDGTLVRRAAGEQPPVPTSGTLSSWLESLRTWGSTCTLLIAGGDLSITGRIEVDGPLVIVAGGRIRFSGAIALGPVDPQSPQRGPVEVPLSTLNRVTATREGGPVLLTQKQGEVAATSLPLEIDPPTANPLREALRLAVLSAPIPPNGRVASWRSPALLGGHAGAGRWRVRFAGERATPAGTSEEIVVDDPELLLECRQLRLRIELEVPPGPVWDPPWVHHVEVSWDEEQER